MKPEKNLQNSEIFDVAIIGGGVVGASVFNKAVRLGKRAMILDKASDVGTGASKANSGIVHAGYDPKPNSLKARMNVRGNELFRPLCKRLSVPLNECGALVVGNDEEKISDLVSRAKENKVSVEVWSREKIKVRVPEIADGVTIGLFAPTSCVVSPYYLTISLVDEAILNGGKVFLEQDLVSVKKVDEVFEISTKTDKFFAKSVVNSAGAGYNEVAKILGTEEKKLEFRRGEYFVFEHDSLDVNITIFPLPSAVGKGVLVTPTADGNHLVGPTSEPSDTRTIVTLSGLDELKQKASTTVKNIDFRHAIREFSGIRTICGDDFVIEKSKKVQGVINLAGICSPGLTSAPAIAEEVCKMLGFGEEEVKGLKKLPKFTLFKNMPKSEQIKALSQNPAYGQIVCKCEKITRGDIQLALDRPLKISSVDAVKRRTNAGMGRCQQGFCFTKVVKEISETRKIAYECVKKENRGSEVSVGEIRK